MASNAALLMAIRTMSSIWGPAALVASQRTSSGFVCGHEAPIRDAADVTTSRPPSHAARTAGAFVCAAGICGLLVFTLSWRYIEGGQSAHTK
jgi:hypothetical protein